MWSIHKNINLSLYLVNIYFFLIDIETSHILYIEAYAWFYTALPKGGPGPPLWKFRPPLAKLEGGGALSPPFQKNWKIQIHFRAYKILK